MNSLLFFSCLLGVIVAVLGLFKPLEKSVQKIYAWVPLPALLLGLYTLSEENLEISKYPNLLLGLEIGLDILGRAFFILIALVWLIVGLYSQKVQFTDEQKRIFRSYFLVTFTGTISVTISHDAPSFYAGYALMTLGGYGLITLANKTADQIAGRAYIVIALIGEILVLAGLIIAASDAPGFSLAEIARSVREAPSGRWSFWLIFIGFGAKVGLVPIHFWLPRAYYWAPLPAVAVLSGAMTKAGVLGWLRFLHQSESATTSTIVICAGILMAFYGVVAGIYQTRAKTTLAFSSLSQMGYLTMAFGTSIEPGVAVTKSLTATVVFAFHHGFTKVALFLGLGLLTYYSKTKLLKKILFGCLFVCSYGLVGLPFSGGLYAKTLLKSVGNADGFWSSVSDPLLTLGSIGTGLLMARFLVLCYREEHDQVQAAPSKVPWLCMFVFVLLSAWLLPYTLEVLHLDGQAPLGLLENLLPTTPVVAGLGLALLITHKIWRHRSSDSPRPFNVISQRLYKAFWEDFPQQIDRIVAIGSLILHRVHNRMKLEEKNQLLISMAGKVHTTWFLGCLLLLSIALTIFLLQAVGGSL